MKKITNIIVSLTVLLTVSCGTNVDKIISEFSLSNSSSEIVGGTPVTGNNWSSVVALTSKKHGSYFCSGVLLSPTTVATAAHCIEAQKRRKLDATDIFIHVGNGKEGGRFVGQYQAKEMYAHPRYDDEAPMPAPYDFGVIYLKKPIDLDKEGIMIIPPLLSNEYIDKTLNKSDGSKVTLVGFGKRYMSTSSADYDPENKGRKHEIEMKVDSLNESYFIFFGATKNGVSHGDSGGPAFIKDPAGNWRVLGLAHAVVEVEGTSGELYDRYYQLIAQEAIFFGIYENPLDPPHLKCNEAGLKVCLDNKGGKACYSKWCSEDDRDAWSFEDYCNSNNLLFSEHQSIAIMKEKSKTDDCFLLSELIKSSEVSLTYSRGLSLKLFSGILRKIVIPKGIDNADNFADFEYLTALEEIDYECSSYTSCEGEAIPFIEDLSVFGKLVNLRKLDLAVMIATSDHSPLKYLTKLKYLNMAEAITDDLSPISNLKNLEELLLEEFYVNGDKELAYRALSGLSRLRILNLRFNEIENIDFLSSLENLVSLNLSMNKITDLTPLASLKNMKTLVLDENPIDKNLCPTKTLNKPLNEFCNSLAE